MANDRHMLIARSLRKTYGKGSAAVEALRGADISVGEGEFLAVMGPSGSGKSTLLHVIGLMTPADSGSLEFDGEPAPREESARTALRRTRIGFVFQRFNLLGVLSAADNIAVSLRIRGIKGDGRIDDLMAQMGVSQVARRKPGQMSVGEQQRVAVVRALAHRPALVLADEPTGNLDSDSAAALLELLKSTNRRQGQTIVMITHSPTAASYADRVVQMKDGIIVSAAD